MAVCVNDLGQRYYCNSGWYDWGRWVVLGLIILGAILFFFLFSCVTARRRRRHGQRPMYGTGWATAGPMAPHQPQNYQQPPPQYNANPQGGYYGENQSYFGGQQTGIQMQTPPNAYKGGAENTYQPPSGPPPSKR